MRLLSPAAPPGYPPFPQEAAISVRSVKHARTMSIYRQSPIPKHTEDAFEDMRRWLSTLDSSNHIPLIIDSGCGTGRSTRIIAENNPCLAVVGVDRSVHRLQRRFGPSRQPKTLPDNAILLRAELAGFWRLLLDRGLAARVQKHYLLYPNPYPKSTQASRRWAAHPVFPLLLQLGGSIEVRSNWFAYLLEVQAAMRALSSAHSVPVHVQQAARRRLPCRFSAIQLESEAECLTQFEVKYHAAGHGLYSLNTS
mmetsp:Transcript_16557/g.35140  ORF Transcript_16557/g.35140 Transcript_16557/m.35140 type:complete len:252 (-) Transcript_16557:297-1052(-)|eukprot:6211737-Pleurochrysis_carterae.AAC.3